MEHVNNLWSDTVAQFNGSKKGVGCNTWANIVSSSFNLFKTVCLLYLIKKWNKNQFLSKAIETSTMSNLIIGLTLVYIDLSVIHLLTYLVAFREKLYLAAVKDYAIRFRNCPSIEW